MLCKEAPRPRSICWARAVSLRLVLQVGGAGREFKLVVSES